jgi:hypothetical protein
MQGEGRNNVLHYVFKFIIDTCMKKSLGDLRKGKVYDALKDLVTKGKDSVKENGQDQDVVSLPQPAKRNVLQLRALLDMLALLQDYCDFGMHSFVHEARALLVDCGAVGFLLPWLALCFVHGISPHTHHKIQQCQDTMKAHLSTFHDLTCSYFIPLLICSIPVWCVFVRVCGWVGVYLVQMTGA